MAHAGSTRNEDIMSQQPYRLPQPRLSPRSRRKAYDIRESSIRMFRPVIYSHNNHHIPWSGPEDDPAMKHRPNAHDPRCSSGDFDISTETIDPDPRAPIPCHHEYRPVQGPYSLFPQTNSSIHENVMNYSSFTQPPSEHFKRCSDFERQISRVDQSQYSMNSPRMKDTSLVQPENQQHVSQEYEKQNTSAVHDPAKSLDEAESEEGKIQWADYSLRRWSTSSSNSDFTDTTELRDACQ
ncbi:unnamed protein product [Periconia digitata]|uniref:Uncharacterized protein n=1 Tax=Periconia digitata TaxID=1303443 RepID=A0A9W4XU78_9PLEO|nr:unnamed protein product [Periconia digitata]